MTTKGNRRYTALVESDGSTASINTTVAIKDGEDIQLRARDEGNTGDSGDLVFADKNGVELARLYRSMSGSQYMIHLRNGSDQQSYPILTNANFVRKEVHVPYVYSNCNTSFGGNGDLINTTQFVALVKSIGAFNGEGYWITRGTWTYAVNQTINDTGVGNICLTGSVVEVFGYEDSFTCRITTPSTSVNSGQTNTIFTLVYNGVVYLPTWSRYDAAATHAAALS